MVHKKIKFVRGFDLVETLIYIALLVVLTLAIINSLTIMSKTYRDVRGEKSIITSANTFLNRFEYEVRRSNGISGTFGTTSSSLTLTMGATSTIISLDNTNRVIISVNGVSDYLTSSEVQVTSLQFNQLIATSTSAGVLLQFSMKNNFGTPKTENFETGALLRDPSN